MEHPFEVGGTYRNRKDEYEVISLDGPNMTIRYRDGTYLETTVELQARIWGRIQAEEREKSCTGTSSPPDGRGRGFHGLQESDFKKGVAGTTWRARTSLGGLLAQRMTDKTGRSFQSHATYRRAEVHIVEPAYYDRDRKERAAKLVFALEDGRAWYGFYIEKNDGPLDGTWDWTRFIAASRTDTGLQTEITAAMQRLDLRWQAWVDLELSAQVSANAAGLVWQDGREHVSWSDWVGRLEAIETGDWCSLFLTARMEKERALIAGVRVDDLVVKVYQALLPLYEASTRRSG